MLKIPKLKMFTLLLLAGTFVGFGYIPAASASTNAPGSPGGLTQSDLERITNLCGQKLHISPKTKDKGDVFILGGCEEGYIAGLQDEAASAACDTYKSNSDALKACNDTGFQLGKSNPLNIKTSAGNTGPGGGPGAGNTCVGSACAPTPTGAGQNCTSTSNCDLISLYVNPFIRLLSIVVGLVVTASLIMGGIQYITSSGDTQKVSAAKSRITNTLLAFLFYAFLYAFLNFIIPGGIFF